MQMCVPSLIQTTTNVVDLSVLLLQLRRMQEMIARMQAQMQLQRQGGEGDGSAVHGHHV